MGQVKPILQKLPFAILVAGLLAVYLATMAPGLTWANYGADGGDLIAAAASGGIAHPTGYPFYLLLARMFQWIPLGSLAFRTSLLSALAAVSAAGWVYGMITGFLPAGRRWNWLAGLAGGFAFGLAPLIWSQAVITEVYALHSLFVAFLLYLLSKPLSVRFTQARQDWMAGLTFGLAMGNHVTIIFLMPVVLLTTIQRRNISDLEQPWFAGWQVNIRSLARRVAWMGCGLLVYLALPLRAGQLG